MYQVDWELESGRRSKKTTDATEQDTDVCCARCSIQAVRTRPKRGGLNEISISSIRFMLTEQDGNHPICSSEALLKVEAVLSSPAPVVDVP